MGNIEITYRTEAYWKDYLYSIDRIDFKLQANGINFSINDHIKTHFDENILLHHYIDLTEQQWKEIFSPVFIFMTYYHLPKSFLVDKANVGDFSKIKIRGIFLSDLSHLIDALFKPKAKVKPKYLTYVMIDHNTGYYKIGKSTTPSGREKTLQSEKPTIEMIVTIDLDIENDLHKIFDAKRIRGEWFALDQEDINFIKGMTL